MGIIHVPEGRGILRSLSVRENLRFSAVAIGRNIKGEDYARVLSVFPQLEPLIDRPAGLLSGGEQQMLAIARGLMTRPHLLMVDELSLGLSPKATLAVMSALLAARKSEGFSLLLVDQSVVLLALACDRLYALRAGTTTRIEEPSSLSKRELLAVNL
jgi:ABC-type branched-subunit amino acid transport system ATPase component